MKLSIFHLAATSVFITGLTCWGQPNLDPVANNAVSRTVAPMPPAETSERAEDAALLKELEADNAQNNHATTHRKRISPRAAAEGGFLPPMAGGGGMSYRLLAQPGAASRALIIRTSDFDPKTEAALEEDRAVMSHLLNKSLEELPGGPGNGNKVMGIDLFYAPGHAPSHTLYLDNYGAVFFLSVNFPLLAPSEKRPEEKPTGDSAWEEARQELYGQRSPDGAIGERAEEYSQEKVEKLKDTLFDALKNATNIRGLKPDEFVTILVDGGSSSARFRVVRTTPPAAGMGNFFATDTPPTAAKRTLLTIRARKTDLDDYAKGKLSPEEFKKRAQVTAYTGEPSGADGLVFGSFAPRVR